MHVAHHPVLLLWSAPSLLVGIFVYRSLLGGHERADRHRIFFLSFFLFFSIKTWRNQATQKMSDRHCHWALKGYADGV
jgi:hypothetical protein